MKMTSKKFEEEYKKLNKAQKEAVDTIEGPVMVIAGPGTGKTQILALRIGNILKKTDIGADSILCLTFTNSAVSAMRERLYKYIGAEASRVHVSTFHKFSGEIIEKFHSALHFDMVPKVLEDSESVSICDQILRENEWKYLRPRGDIGRHFKELKSLISLLKRERMSPEEFKDEIEKEISHLKKDPESISTRGESKGNLKKDILNKIESLEKTREIVDFYRLYEEKKREEDLLDYDDEIKYALEIVEKSEEARAEIQINYQYVLIDEHQDSSGAQNALLKAIWAGGEKPNIFAVGDDRQLIYAFGGAKMSHFEDFQTMFGKTRTIFLTDNYRSTQSILDTADALLSSSFSDKKLVAIIKEKHNLKLVECDYPRDEIIACGLDMKEKIKKEKVDPRDCAILVPKNKQVISAIKVLEDLGFEVASRENLSLFETPEFQSIFRVLKICTDSNDFVSLSESILDPIAGIPVMVAHGYLYKRRDRETGLLESLSAQRDLFKEHKEVKDWFLKLESFVLEASVLDIYSLIQKIGDEMLLKTADRHGELLRRVEIVRSLLHLALSFSEKNKNSLADFIFFVERLQKYGEDIPLAVFKTDEGMKVLTLHGSKGLEFDFVWIAHMDEDSLMKGKRRNFKLPESVEEKIEEKDELAAKRELYVAITRAKRFCALSYSRFSYNGRDQEEAKILANLEIKTESFEKIAFKETEEKILAHDPKIYVLSQKIKKKEETLPELLKMVSKEYAEANVSVSLLNNFFECPRKWYFRNLLKLPEPKSDSLQFGTRVHSVIDKILKSGKTPDEKEVLKFSEGDESAAKIILRWVKNSLPKISGKRENEKSVSFRSKEFPHLNIYGKVDLVEDLGSGSTRVTDFKTGGARKKSEIEKIDEEGRMSNYMRQLAMYSYLLEENTKYKEVVESKLEFVEAGKENEYSYTTHITEEKIKLLKKDIADYDRLVKTGEWWQRPCNYNSYGKNTECEYCKMMAEIYKN